MKQAKQRVVAIDYFRGLFILVVVINHAAAFSLPFAYLAGASGLWTSAAEMFMLISGITLSVVRAGSIRSDFWQTAKKIWRRAAIIYLLDIVAVILSLTLALFLVSHNLPNGVDGSLPTKSGLGLLWGITSLSYGIGWAGFLGYFAVFNLFSPFLLYLLKSRYWILVPVASISYFTLNSSQLSSLGVFDSFAIWQVYFILGLTIGRFRVPVISWFYGLRHRTISMFSKTIFAATSVCLALSILLDFNLAPTINSLTADGWLPLKFQHAYAHLSGHWPTLNLLVMDGRTGVLRPAVALLFLASVYLLYQRYKNFLLTYTGKFMNSLGRDTLWIFIAQAFTIPLLDLLPVPRNLVFNFGLTSLLIYLMWMVTKRRKLAEFLKRYLATLKEEYNEAKYAASYRQAE